MVAISVRFHLGKEGLKSGKDVTPGHSASAGVPRILRRQLAAITRHVKMKSGEILPEDLEDLVDLRVTREKRLTRAHLCEDAAH